MVVNISTPPSSSPLSAIQGTRAYGNGNPNTTTTITYNFDQYAGSTPWTNAYKDDFRKALAVFESVANIRFVEVSNWQDADIYEVLAPNSNPYFFDSPYTLGYHYTPSNNPSEGAFSTDYWDAGPGGNGDAGGYFFTTLLHELGHALGLAHPHDSGLGTTVMRGVTGPFDSFGASGLNQGVYTVMSYNDGWTSKNGILPVDAKWGGATGLGALDIAALQNMYGANNSYNSGSNTYDLATSNASGVGYQAIWDTGGSDTIRYSGSGITVIDLRPATLDYSSTGGGGVSHVGGVKGGFTIAAGVVIENASGGSGKDTIFGNAAVNTLNGNGGNDTFFSASNGSNNNTINGGGGSDTIYLANGSGADTVNGGSGNDVAIVRNNTGSFSGGTGTDTVRFVSAISKYLFINNGSTYEFLDVITGRTFTVSSDVERFEFSNGNLGYNLAQLTNATQISDVETTGTALQHAAQGIYLIGGPGSTVAVTKDGQVMGENSLAGWSAIQVEDDGQGYRILWQHNNGRHVEWVLDDQGARTGGQEIFNVVDVEVFYGADLNNDGTVGHVTTTIENEGSVTLGSSTRGMYLIDDTIELTRGGDVIGPDSLAGWSAIQVEDDGQGYRILWQHNNGRHVEWVLDDQGARTGGQEIFNVVDVEVFYGADLDGSGFIGPAPKVAQQKMAHLAPISDSLSDEPEFDFVPLDTNHASEGEELLANDFDRSERLGLDGTSEPESIDIVDSGGDLGIASILEDDVFLL